jgi:glutaminyl-tRNA synthetase
VTHSICTLEFEVHRPLYDWFIDQLTTESYRPRQYEFNKLQFTYTLLSKRNLRRMVEDKILAGWDDPRMPTLCGFRRRGYTPESIHNLIDRIGYTKYDGVIDIGLLEYAVREDLNKRVTRVSAVLDPVKLVITNYPEGQSEPMEAQNNPEDENSGSHSILFSRELYIERDDFMEEAPKKYFRLTPGSEVRLKNAYIIKCTGCKKDDAGNVIEVYAEYDPLTKSGMPESGRKVKGTIHWVSTQDCFDAEVRLYDRLFMVENPADDDRDIVELLNPDSLKVLRGCKMESYLKDAKPGDKFQFQRTGYFCVDRDTTPDNMVFNRTVSLKDSWAKEKGK